MTTDERLDKLIERHESLTHTVELLAAMQLKTEERLDGLAAMQEKTEERLQRAIDFGVEEARRERERRREAITKAEARHQAAMAAIDGKLDQLASAQLVTEQLLQRFLARGGNGHTGAEPK